MSSQFDWKFYTEYYEDLSYLSSYEQAYEHWINFGKQEGRIALEKDFYKKNGFQKDDIPINFNWHNYLELHPDLQSHLHSKWQAIQHFMIAGIQEGRRYSFHIKDEINYYYQAIEREAEQPFQVYKNLIQYLESQGRLNEMLEIYQKGTQLYPQQQLIDEKLYYKMLEIKPDDGRLYVALGNELARQERKDGAIACYQMALLIKPDAPEIVTKLQALAS